MTQTMMNVVDTIMAGRVSATDMAAVAIASSIALPILFFLQGIMLVLPPIISRHNGAKTFADTRTREGLPMACCMRQNDPTFQ